MSLPTTISPGENVRLENVDPDEDGGLNRQQVEAETEQHVTAISTLAERLYAENRRALLLILQGMDTSGKDGTIRHTLRGVNPQSCQVTPFKQPTWEELDHDFLWRIHRTVPAKGNIGIFNRSHYEDVIVVRVKDLVPKNVWERRYDQINAFEQLLVDEGVTLVKVFLHISKEEQRERLQERLDDPEKRWKFRRGDLEDRKLWDDYMQAYQDVLTRCNTKHAPWHIVPANRKWYRNLVISRLLHETLEKLNPQFPEAEDLEGVVVE